MIQSVCSIQTTSSARQPTAAFPKMTSTPVEGSGVPRANSAAHNQNALDRICNLGKSQSTGNERDAATTVAPHSCPDAAKHHQALPRAERAIRFAPSILRRNALSSGEDPKRQAPCNLRSCAAEPNEAQPQHVHEQSSTEGAAPHLDPIGLTKLEGQPPPKRAHIDSEPVQLHVSRTTKHASPALPRTQQAQLSCRERMP